MHVQGSAQYIDDIAVPDGTLHVAFALSNVAHGKIKSIDVNAARVAEGVHSVLLADEIENLLIGPIRHDEPILASKEVLFYGQAIAAILAESHDQAKKAALLVTAEIEELESIVSIDQAMKSKSFLDDPIIVSTGNSQKAIKDAKNSLTGSLSIGGQEHYYLEGQVAMSIPTERMKCSFILLLKTQPKFNI